MRQKVLGFIGVVMPVIPMIGPMVGAGVMAVGSWRWISRSANRNSNQNGQEWNLSVWRECTD